MSGPVHLLWPARSGLACCACGGTGGAPTVVIGSSADARQARVLGARVVAVVPAPRLGTWGWLTGESAGLRRRVGRVLDGLRARAVVAWAPDDLDALPAAWLGRTVLATTEPPPMARTDDDCPWRRVARVGVLARPAMEAWSAAVGGRAMPLDLPPATVGLGDRAVVRAALGIGPNEVALSLLTDPASAGDARLFAWIVGVLHVAGLRAVGIAPAGAACERRAARYLRLHGRHWEVISHHGPAAQAVQAADIAVFGLRHELAVRDELAGASPLVGGQSGPTVAASAASTQGRWGRGLLLAWRAMASGVPVIAADDPATRWLLGPAAADRSIAAIVTMPACAPRIMPLVDDPAALLALRQAQHERWRELASGSRFEAQLAELVDAASAAVGVLG